MANSATSMDYTLSHQIKSGPESVLEMLAEAFGGGGGRVEIFPGDGWAQSWPVGPEMLCDMLTDEAHHRGQVCMLVPAVQCCRSYSHYGVTGSMR
jgi:hypothetical protein